jgi:sortase A
MVFPPVARVVTIRYFFLAVAIVCLGLYSYSYLQRVAYQSWESREFDRALESAAVAVTPAGDAARSSHHGSGALVGRLSIPRLHLSAMVREGVDRETLLLAVGHIPATALPGQPGNVGVAGHRDTFFRRLKDLRTGDEIRFSTLSGDFKYVVESLTVVEPDDVAVLAPSPQNVLTLVTCYPFYYVGNAPKRFVVRARQIHRKHWQV